MSTLGDAVPVLRRRHAEGFLKCRTETIVGPESDLIGDLVDRVVGFFQQRFGPREAKTKAVLIGTCLEEFTEAPLQFEFVDAGAVGQHGNVEVMDGILFDEGPGEFNGRDVVELRTLNGMGVALDSFFAHGIRFICLGMRYFRLNQTENSIFTLAPPNFDGLLSAAIGLQKDGADVWLPCPVCASFYPASAYGLC